MCAPFPAHLADITDNLAWTYDKNSNRQTDTRNGTNTAYTYTANSNKLATVTPTGGGAQSRTYDAMGSTLKIASQTYTYDGYGRMTVANPPYASYDYNALGERTLKAPTGTSTTVFAYSPGGQLLYEASGSNTKAYVYLNGKPLARIDNNTSIYYYHTDQLGTPQAMTDAAGTVVWKADYEPFGKALIRTQTIVNNLRLPGQYFDAETGLHYNYLRDYDSGTGRYVEADPIGLAGGSNLYSYANQNPLSYTDPLGLWAYHGSWCGPDWTGGIEGSYDPEHQNEYKPPEDSLDLACRDHDICYWKCRDRNPCDKDARARCMTNCDRDLASSSRVIGRKNSPLGLWMEKNNLPSPGNNSPNCGCQK